MRWKPDRSNAYMKHAVPEREQSTKDTLQHFGVPGMHWGVITKEYEKKGYANRYQNTDFATGLKKKRTRQQMAAPMYKRGRQVGQKFMANVYDKYGDKLKREEDVAQQVVQEPQERRPDLIDRATERVADHLGLREYSEVASEFIKQRGKDLAISYLKKNPKKVGEFLQKPLNLLGKGVQKVVIEPTIDMVNAAPKTVFKGTKFIAKNGYKSIKTVKNSISSWIRTGEYKNIHQKAMKMAERLRGMPSVVAQQFANTVRKGTGAASAFTSFISQKISSFAAQNMAGAGKSVAQIAQRGVVALARLLARIRS